MDEEGWGAKRVDRIAIDLGNSLPEMGVFTRHTQTQILQQLVAKLPWGHNIVLNEFFLNGIPFKINMEPRKL